MNWCPLSLDRAVLEPLIWADAKRRYLRGEPVRAICRRYGFGKTTFYDHASAGGWARPPLNSAALADESPASLEPTELGPQAEALVYLALGHVAEGNAKGADEALKAAGRLLRIKRHLGEAAEVREPTPGEIERARIAAMTKPELIAEIKRRAGMEE
ncbi:MAG: hypothetical protein AAF292_08895 [Pseudomonadota bacterium]